MDREIELATRERLHAQESRLQELMKNIPAGASVPSEDLITATVEIEDLRNELEFLQNHSVHLGRNPQSTRTSAEIAHIGQHLYSKVRHQHIQHIYYRFKTRGGNGRLLVVQLMSQGGLLGFVSARRVCVRRG